MKKIFSKSIFVLFLLATFSCKKEFLDRDPIGKLTSSTFFTTEEHAVQSVNAIYQQLRVWETHAFGFLGATDIMSDDADKGSTPNDGLYLKDLDDFIHTSDNTAVKSIWTGYFQGVARANMAIEKNPSDCNERKIENSFDW